MKNHTHKIYLLSKNKPTLTKSAFQTPEHMLFAPSAINGNLGRDAKPSMATYLGMR